MINRKWDEKKTPHVRPQINPEGKWDWDGLGLPGFHIHFITAPTMTPFEELQGLPGEYQVRFTFSRPGHSLKPEYDFDRSGKLIGDSHLALIKPAVDDPNKLDSYVRDTYIKTKDGDFVFHGYPNKEGYLSYMETESFQAENIPDATTKAFCALNPVLSTEAVYHDIPFQVCQITVIEIRNQNTRVECLVPYQGATFAQLPMETLTKDYCVYAGLYREALNSNSPFYQFLCYHKIIDGIRFRRDRLSREMRTKGEPHPQFPSERVPNNAQEQIEWLNSLFPEPIKWNDMALDGIFPEEAVGKKINRVIDAELTPLRNRIAHSFLESGEPGLLVDDILYSDMVTKWLPLAKCLARHFIKEEFPDAFRITINVPPIY